MIPPRRFAIRSETPLVIMRKNRLAIRPRNLPPKNRRRLWILQRHHQRPQPVVSLRRGVRIQKNSELRSRQFHPVVHHARWIVFLFFNLNEVRRLCVPNQIDGAIRGAGIDDDQFPVFVVLCHQCRQRLAQRPTLVVGAHDDADGRLVGSETAFGLNRSRAVIQQGWVAHKPFAQERDFSPPPIPHRASLAGRCR